MAASTISMIVFPHFLPGAQTRLTRVSPAKAAGELIENCLSFRDNDDATIMALCRLVEQLPVHRLHFSDPKEASDILVEAQASLQLPVPRTWPDAPEPSPARSI